MSSLYAGLNVALRAMLAQQQVIEVINHNVSNASTPGYHRQTAVLSAGMPTSMSSFHNSMAIGEVGTGVTVDKIQRYTLDFMDDRYRKEVSTSSRWDVESSSLQQVEAQMSESGDDGLVKKLDAFWGSWQSLSSDPTNAALKADLLDNSKSLAMAFNRRSEVLSTIQKDVNQSLDQRVDEVNTLADQVAKLNQEIVHVKAAGEQPNDLMDTRDVALDRLSELTGAQIHTQPDGSSLVSINGHSLVFGNTSYKLVIKSNFPNDTLAWDDNGNGTYDATDQNFTPVSGEMAGLMDVRDNIIPGQQDGLDKLAYELANKVNSYHNPTAASTPPLNGAPYVGNGMDFFTVQDGSGPLTSYKGAAGVIQVSSQMDNLDNIMGASASVPGDNTMARMIAGLKQVSIAGLNNMTPNDFYTIQVTALGQTISNAKSVAANSKNVSTTLSQQRESLVGVSLDEEAADMVKAQRAFEAASRLINTMDDMLNKIINGTGRVGL
jgi:flagellar hook-associated protein 1